MTAKTVLKCAALAVVLASIGLAGCGRRGDLEPAPDSGVSAKEAREKAQQAVQPQRLDGTPAGPRAGGIVKPTDPFILDPLL